MRDQVGKAPPVLSGAVWSRGLTWKVLGEVMLCLFGSQAPALQEVGDSTSRVAKLRVGCPFSFDGLDYDEKRVAAQTIRRLQREIDPGPD